MARRGRPARATCGPTSPRVIVAKRRLSTLDHTPYVVGMTYVYSVVSRRPGGV